MCGIFGVASTSVIDRKNFSESLNAMSHRGPDYTDIIYANENKVGIGHNRLSILDLTTNGNQPMYSSDGRHLITFNGEIYNYIEIKKELLKLGHKFKSNSDTEVVLSSYIEWGKECLYRFNGMFSFCIFDRNKSEFFIARDRMGIKPLYYYWDNKTFCFSSELNSIISMKCVKKDIDNSAVYDYLTYYLIPPPKTIYKFIRKLEKASFLIFNIMDNKITGAVKYWNINNIGGLSISKGDAQQTLLEKIDKSIELRFRSDVPVGTLLSGGLDSSIIITRASKLINTSINSFNIEFHGSNRQENENAKLVSTNSNSRFYSRTLDYNKCFSKFTSLHKSFGEPFADTSLIPTYFVCELASKHHKVVLSGDGADELFFGYNWYKKFSKTNRYISSLAKVILHNKIDNLLKVRSFDKFRNIKQVFLDNPIERLIFIRGGMIREEKQAVLDSDFMRYFKGYDDYWYYKKYWLDHEDINTNLQYLDFNTFLSDDVLQKVDVMSMLNSLEVRVPFLDHNVVEYVFSLPNEIRNRYSDKTLLKSTFESHLPHQILTQPKQGFSIPLQNWNNKLGLIKDNPSNIFNMVSTHNLTPMRKYQINVLSLWDLT